MFVDQAKIYIKAGDGGDGAFQRLKGAVQHHVGALAHREGGGICCRELQPQHHFGAVTDDRHFLTAGHFVALGHLEGTHNTCHLGADILAVCRLVVAALCLLQSNGRLLRLGGGIGGVHRVQHGAFLHDVPFLKAAGQHLARYQRLNIIRIGRVQSAGSAEGVGHIPLGRRDLHIVDVRIGVLCLVRAQDEPSAQHGHAHHRHYQFCTGIQFTTNDGERYR